MYIQGLSWTILCKKCDRTCKKLKPNSDYELMFRCPKCKTTFVVWDYPQKTIIVYIN